MINIRFLTSVLAAPSLQVAEVNPGGAAVIAIAIALIVYYYYKKSSNSNKADNEEVQEEKIIKSELGVDQTASVSTSPDNQNLTNDTELVAVITAAIMASMEEEGMEIPEDGLIIRSIRRKTQYGRG